MKRFLTNTRQQMREYWRRAMDSSKIKLSRGVEHINRFIAFARNNEWRRKKK
jgi:hypothetical protein